MPTYIMLAHFTDQGIRNVKDTTKRAHAAGQLAKSVGANLKELYWTLGQYDVVGIVEAPDEKTITAFGLNWAKLGNLRTQTLQAFTQTEMGAILDKIK